MDTLTIQPDATTEDIHLAFGTFSLGTLLVAAGTLGVAAILLGDDKRALRSELAAAFPQARLTLDDASPDMVGQVVAFLDAPHKGLDLPPTFEARPSNRRFGRPCLRFRPAIPSPMARSPSHCPCRPLRRTWAPPAPPMSLRLRSSVVGSSKADGSISGYRWGVQRKRKLINREGVA